MLIHRGKHFLGAKEFNQRPIFEYMWGRERNRRGRNLAVPLVRNKNSCECYHFQIGARDWETWSIRSSSGNKNKYVLNHKFLSRTYCLSCINDLIFREQGLKFQESKNVEWVEGGKRHCVGSSRWSTEEQLEAGPLSDRNTWKCIQFSKQFSTLLVTLLLFFHIEQDYFVLIVFHLGWGKLK